MKKKKQEESYTIHINLSSEKDVLFCETLKSDGAVYLKLTIDKPTEVLSLADILKTEKEKL